MFPNIISKAANVELICNGEGPNKNGEIQLVKKRDENLNFFSIMYKFLILKFCFHCQMFAELQMLTPTIPTREVYFARICKQLSTDQWTIVDVSIDKIDDNIDALMAKCRKRPSGCIIEDKANGHCKVLCIYISWN